MRIGECKHWDWSKPRPPTYPSSYILIGLISFPDGCIFGSPSLLNINNAAKETCLFRWMCRWRANDCWFKKWEMGEGWARGEGGPRWWNRPDGSHQSPTESKKVGGARLSLFIRREYYYQSSTGLCRLVRFLINFFSTYELLPFNRTVSPVCPSFFSQRIRRLPLLMHSNESSLCLTLHSDFYSVHCIPSPPHPCTFPLQVGSGRKDVAESLDKISLQSLDLNRWNTGVICHITDCQKKGIEIAPKLIFPSVRLSIYCRSHLPSNNIFSFAMSCSQNNHFLDSITFATFFSTVLSVHYTLIRWSVTHGYFFLWQTVVQNKGQVICLGQHWEEKCGHGEVEPRYLTLVALANTLILSPCLSLSLYHYLCTDVSASGVHTCCRGQLSF